MVVLGEQCLVLQGDFQIGRMQVRECGLAGVRQVLVIEDEVEQHANQVDHVGFLIGHLAVARQAAVRFQLLLQVGLEAFNGLRLMQALGQFVG